MPVPPPRAPTLPSFADSIQEIDDSEFVDNANNPTPSDMQPVTPLGARGVDGASGVPVAPLPVAQRKSRLVAVLLWRDPKLSGVVFGANMLFFYLTLVRGSSVLSVIGALFAVYIALRFVSVHVNARIGGKLDKYIARPPVGTLLFRREPLIRAVDTIVEEGNEISDELRDMIYCDKMAVAGGWMFVALSVYFIGMHFSLLAVFFVCTLALFSLPLAYEKNKKQVDDALAKVTDAASKQIETGRKAAVDRAVMMRDTAAERSGPYLEKAPPAARNFAEKLGLTPKKKGQ